MMEAKPFETKYGGVRSTYHNEDLLRFNIITKDNDFIVFVMDGAFHVAIPVALPVSPPLFLTSYIRWVMTINHCESRAVCVFASSDKAVH